MDASLIAFSPPKESLSLGNGPRLLEEVGLVNCQVEHGNAVAAVCCRQSRHGIAACLVVIETVERVFLPFADGGINSIFPGADQVQDGGHCLLFDRAVDRHRHREVSRVVISVGDGRTLFLGGSVAIIPFDRCIGNVDLWRKREGVIDAELLELSQLSEFSVHQHLCVEGVGSATGCIGVTLSVSQTIYPCGETVHGCLYRMRTVIHFDACEHVAFVSGQRGEVRTNRRTVHFDTRLAGHGGDYVDIMVLRTRCLEGRERH